MFNNMINWNLASGAVKSTTPVRTPTNPYLVQITGTGSRYYRFWQEIAQSSNAITELESEGGVSNQEADCLSLSYDDKYILHIGQYNFSSDINKGKLYVADLNTKKILWKKNQFDAAVFANTSNTIAAANTLVVPNKSGYSSIQLFEGATGNLIKTFTVPAESQEAYGMVFSPKDTYLTLSPYNMNGNLYSYDCQYLIETATGKLTQISKILPNGKHFKFQGFTPDEKYMIVTVKYRPHEEVFFYDIRQQKWDLTKTVPVNEKNSINSISVTKDNRFMFTNTQEYNVKLWDLGSKRLLATLYPIPSTGDWAIVMPDGRFDASPAAQKDLYFVKGINTFPLEILYETFYAPKLLPRLLAGEQFAPIDTDFDNLKKAPVAKITYEQKTRNLFVEDNGLPTYENTTGLAQVTVNATTENDKIDEIRLFHNGKIVNLATRGLFVTDDATSTDSKKYEIKLMEGQKTPPRQLTIHPKARQQNCPCRPAPPQ
jgi:WD40 repeat protein